MVNKKFKKEIIFGLILIILEANTVSGYTYNLNYSNTLNPGNWLYVGGSGPGNYSTITEALFYANNGDTIFVYDDSSPYYEQVNINKEVFLIGENTKTTIVDASNSTEVIFVKANNVTIKGFTITNGTVGIQITGDYVIIKNNIICNNYNYGISISGFGDSNIISENTISDNGHEEPNVTTGYGGIYLALTATNKIKNNNFINNSNTNAFFFKSFLNIWMHNYWDKPRIFPYPILGLQAIIPPIFWLQFDLKPRLSPFVMP
ncbi:MAG: right-handed parallel beta-helix repeat-containing protein [Candidatus Thermoplasmatota archaeon]|jgi:hypothetical protein|nr:right-handed parallel beta-helix repeat-containing protein [Candidatus Thermoplasmatota archaeon]